MDFWQLLYIIDWFLFGIVALTVLYLMVFTIASLFFHQHVLTKTKQQNRFIILIYAYNNSGVIHTVKFWSYTYCKIYFSTIVSTTAI